MTKMPKISSERLREIIKEELVAAKKADRARTVAEGVDHTAIRDVVTVASKLLAAVEAFKAKAAPAAVNAVTPHLGTIEKVLEDMVSTPGSYVARPKLEPKKVSLKPMKAQ